MIPAANNGWHVRILTGDFVETVIQYNWVKIDEETMTIRLDYELISSPDKDLVADNDVLKTTVSEIMHAILVKMADEVEQHKS